LAIAIHEGTGATGLEDMFAPENFLTLRHGVRNEQDMEEDNPTNSNHKNQKCRVAAAELLENVSRFRDTRSPGRRFFCYSTTKL
jgi:hypothetical protein